MINTRQAVQAGETPEKISISMITQDLKDGVTKAEMSIKYSIKPWEVDEMFKHPELKGKRPARKRVLSFTFVDDISTNTSEPEFAKREADLIEEVEVDPNQVTIEDVISETETETEVPKSPLGDIKEVFSRTFEAAEDDELEVPTFEDTMELVEEQEMEAGTEEEEVEVEEDEYDSFQL